MQSASVPICPECGTAASKALPRDVGWVIRNLRWLTVVVVATVAVTYGLQRMDAVKIKGFPSEPVAVTPGFSSEQLRAIADGDSNTASPLARAVLHAVSKSTEMMACPGDRRVYVSLVQPGGYMRQLFQLGWPSRAIMVSRQTLYSDAISRTGLRSYFTDPSAALHEEFGSGVAPRKLLNVSGFLYWELQVNLPPEWTGGTLWKLEIYLENIADAAVLFLIGRWLARRVQALCVKGLQSRWARHAPLLAGVAAVLLPGLLNAGKETKTMVRELDAMRFAFVGPTPPTGFNLPLLPLRANEIHDLLTRSDGDRQLAASILKTLAQVSDPPAPDARLILLTEPEAEVDSNRSRWVAFPRTWLVASYREMYYRRQESFGPPTPMASEATISINDKSIFIPSRNPDRPSRYLWLMTGRISLLALGLMCVWKLAGLCTSGRWSRAHRRRLRGQCVACGYPLPFVVPK